jgi:hypothetical protein
MITITGGNFQYPNGQSIANGTLTLELSSDSTAPVTAPDGTIVAAIPIQITLDVSGNVYPTYIWSNAELSVPTYYTARVYDVDGIPVLKTPIIWVFTTESGGTALLGIQPPGTIPLPFTVYFYGAQGAFGPQGPTGPTGPTGSAFGATPPTIVQVAEIIYQTDPAYPTAVGWTAHFAATPTPGNLLIMGIISSGGTPPSSPSGFTQYYLSAAITGGALSGYAQSCGRLVQAADGPTWTGTAPSTVFTVFMVEMHDAVLSSDVAGGLSVAGSVATLASPNFQYAAVVFVQTLADKTGGAQYLTAASPASYDYIYVPSVVTNAGYGSFGDDTNGHDAYVFWSSFYEVPSDVITETYTQITDGLYHIVVIPSSLGPGGEAGASGAQGERGVVWKTEKLFLGYFKNGASVAVADIPANYTSPVDGTVYTDQTRVLYYICEFVCSRDPAPPFINGQGATPAISIHSPQQGRLWYYHANVQQDDPSADDYLMVKIFSGYWNGKNEQDSTAGFCKIFAVMNADGMPRT